MANPKAARISRRQAIGGLATLATGALLKPSSLLASVTPVKSTLRLAVVGDWGTGDDDQFALGEQMFQHHRQSAFDFVLTTGDNIYPNGSGRHFRKKFEEPFAGLIKDQVNFYTVLGNHDVEDGRQDQLEYPLFNMRGQSYYSISRGNGLIDFFMIDTTHFDETQTSWLEFALRGSRAKWKVAAFHYPIYSSGKKHGSNLKMRGKIEPLLNRYGVSAVFSGHDHFYERTKPQNGIQYFVTGAGGKTRRGGVDLQSPIRATSYDADNHFMVLEIGEREMGFKAISETGGVVDSGIIAQPE
jgi:predicted MPP superfamily phosphohydrolase